MALSNKEQNHSDTNNSKPANSAGDGQNVDIVGSFLAVMKLFACGILWTWGSRGGSPSLMAIKEPAETGILRWIFVNDRKTGL